jgi:hypothetical protein
MSMRKFVDAIRVGSLPNDFVWVERFEKLTVVRKRLARSAADACTKRHRPIARP